MSTRVNHRNIPAQGLKIGGGGGQAVTLLP